MKVYITAPLSYRFNPETQEECLKFVNAIDSLLKEFKITTYLTYRDFLQWGKVTYNPTTVFEKLDYELKSADLVLVVHPDEGIGPNIVLGLATGVRKPIIIVMHQNFDINTLPGLMYQGFKKITNCEIIIHDSIEELRKKLRLSIKTFLKLNK